MIATPEWRTCPECPTAAPRVSLAVNPDASKKVPAERKAMPRGRREVGCEGLGTVRHNNGVVINGREKQPSRESQQRVVGWAVSSPPPSKSLGSLRSTLKLNIEPSVWGRSSLCCPGAAESGEGGVNTAVEA